MGGTVRAISGYGIIVIQSILEVMLRAIYDDSIGPEPLNLKPYHPTVTAVTGWGQSLAHSPSPTWRPMGLGKYLQPGLEPYLSLW